MIDNGHQSTSILFNSFTAFHLHFFKLSFKILHLHKFSLSIGLKVLLEFSHASFGDSQSITDVKITFVKISFDTTKYKHVSALTLRVS